MSVTKMSLYAREHWVYIIRDQHGMPIYVGLTVNPVKRMHDHINAGWLAPESDHVVYDGPYSRQDGLLQEATVIRALRPELNRNHNADHWGKACLPSGMYDRLPISEWLTAEPTTAWLRSVERKYNHLLEDAAA